jgi:hypothetical protein
MRMNTTTNSKKAIAATNRKRRVRFSETEEGEDVLKQEHESSLDAATFQECIGLVWFSQEEMKQFQRDRYDLITSVRSKNCCEAPPPDTDSSCLCLDGCELFLEGNGVHDIRQRQQRITSMVLHEQNKQRFFGLSQCDPQSVAMVARMCSNHSAHRARQFALKVALEVKSMNGSSSNDDTAATTISDKQQQQLRRGAVSNSLSSLLCPSPRHLRLSSIATTSATTANGSSSSLASILDRGINCLSSSSGEQQQQQPCNGLNDDELQPAMDLFKALKKRNFGVHNHNGSLLNQQQQQQRQPEQQQQNRCRTQTILEEAMRVQEQSQFQSFRPTKRVKHLQQQTTTTELQQKNYGKGVFPPPVQAQLSLNNLLYNF